MLQERMTCGADEVFAGLFFIGYTKHSVWHTGSLFRRRNPPSEGAARVVAVVSAACDRPWSWRPKYILMPSLLLFSKVHTLAVQQRRGWRLVHTSAAGSCGLLFVCNLSSMLLISWNCLSASNSVNTLRVGGRRRRCCVRNTPPTGDPAPPCVAA